MTTDKQKAEKPDWRIGLIVSPKLRLHKLFGQKGKVIDVLPTREKNTI